MCMRCSLSATLLLACLVSAWGGKAKKKTDAQHAQSLQRKRELYAQKTKKETEEEKAKNRERQQKHMQKLKKDPERLKKYKDRQREGKQKYWREYNKKRKEKEEKAKRQQRARELKAQDKGVKAQQGVVQTIEKEYELSASDEDSNSDEHSVVRMFKSGKDKKRKYDVRQDVQLHELTNKKLFTDGVSKMRAPNKNELSLWD